MLLVELTYFEDHYLVKSSDSFVHKMSIPVVHADVFEPMPMIAFIWVCALS